MKVSVSFLSEVLNPVDIIKKINDTSAEYIHVDVMDGKFVNNKTYSIAEIEKLSNYMKKPMDVHLMVNNPKKYIEKLALLNVEYITFHYESVKNIDEVIDLIHNCGLKAGISIKPSTNASEIIKYLDKLDLVLIMSVEPGKSGQSFMNSVLYKIESLKKVIDEKGYKTIISVDGGINEETARLVKDKGADMVVSASFLHDGDMLSKVNLLKEI